MPSRQPLGYSRRDQERRFGPTVDSPDYRPAFARDYDRLIHTAAFRRLQGKTQVVTPGEADFFRTRLTHTLEVAQIARRLAERLHVDADLVEASAILHDLGHPPFGHVGEEALSEVIDEVAAEWGLAPDAVGGFNGNAQNFRLAVKSLTVRGNFEGLNLTRAVLDGAIKYPWMRSAPGIRGSAKRWCFYPTEAREAAWVRDFVPVSRVNEKSLEAQLVEWADDVAYSIHDVEDWYRAGLMQLDALTQSSVVFGRFVDELKAALVSPTTTAADVEVQAVELFRSPRFLVGVTTPYDGSAEAKEALRFARKELFNDLVMGVGIADAAAARKRHLNDLEIAPDVRLRNNILRQLLWFFVIRHPRMGTQQHGQQQIAEALARTHFDALGWSAASGALAMRRDQMAIYPEDMRAALVARASDLPEAIRLVADHLAGMTDSYALRIYGRLSGHDPGAFNVFI